MMATMILLSATACTAGDKVINFKDLPAAAQSVIEQYFKGKTVTFVQKDADGLKSNYDVVLSDGTKLEFDKKGEWKEIDSKPNDVPAGLIPTAITDYVRQSYPDARIIQIERYRNGYEVDLSNGLEVRFNKQMKVTKVDD